MPTYKIISNNTAFVFGTYVYVWPVCEVQPGDMVMVEVNGHLITGIWYPNMLGCDWIVQPGRVIRVRPNIHIRILGVVIKREDPPAEIGFQIGDERFYRSRQLNG
jgi:hypothetical protein